MRTEGFSLFETAIGSCGVAWGPRGLTGVQLPEATETATRSRMLRRFAPAFPIVVPCHRVLAADGRPGGFSAAGGVMTKLRLLSIERVQAPGTLPLFESPA